MVQMLPLNETYVKANPNASNVSLKFHVREEGLQRVFIQTCQRLKSFPQVSKDSNDSDMDHMPYSTVLIGTPIFDIHAKLELLNPYGYLPGTMYGLLPFSGCLILAYLAMDAVFIGLFVIYRKSIIRVQYFILIVLAMATLETSFWYASYRSMNETGKPVCCPYPPLFLVWTVLKVFSEGLARVLLLLVSIGYGVVRPSIKRWESALILLLGVAYTISGITLELNLAVAQAAGHRHPPKFWSAIEIVTNTIFSMWIYIALDTTRNTLKKTNQTAKFQMYDLLVKVLLGYLSIALVFFILQSAVMLDVIDWDWKWNWVVWATGRLLNFLIILGIACIWRPSSTSQLYAYSDQLSSKDDTDDDDHTTTTIQTGRENNEEGDDGEEVEVEITSCAQEEI